MSPQSLNTTAARNLANTTKTQPQMAAITPRWLLRILPWVNVESGTYRVNTVRMATRRSGRIEIIHDAKKSTITVEGLRAIPLFDDLDSELLQAMRDCLAAENFEPGKLIVEEGKDPDKLFIMVRGKADVFRKDDDDEESRHRMLASGDYFGVEQLLGDSKFQFSARAITSCELLTLDEKALKKCLDKFPKIKADFHARIEAKREALENSNGHDSSRDVMAGHEGETELPEIFVDYEQAPREYGLSLVQTIIKLHTRVSDLYNVPLNQLREQIRLTIEGMKEAQEWQIINNPDFGLLHNIESSMRIQPRYGAPTPDDMDDLLGLVWKKPAYFLAHPFAIAAFGRECTRRGVPPPTVNLFGSPFLTWRGVPIIPSSKLEVTTGAGGRKTNILLMRVGEAEQGVIGLHQLNIPNEVMPSLSVRLMEIDRTAIASYLLSLYFSCAVLTYDAVGVIENVEVGRYHDYR